MKTAVYSTVGPRDATIRPDSALLAQALDLAGKEDWVAAYHALCQAAEHPADRRCAQYMLWEVCQALGHPDVGIANLRAALADAPITSRYSAKPRRRVLALAVPGDFQANLPLGALLGAADTELHTLWLTDPESVLMNPLSAFRGVPPAFDCAFIAIAEDVRHRQALRAADELLSVLNRPVINNGARIAALSRAGAARLLRDLPDAIVPSQQLAERGTLTGGAGLDFPVIIRPSNSHAGKNLVRVDANRSLRTYLTTVDDDLFYVAPFIDYRSTDGLWRKYRVIFVDGHPWPYHLGIHDDWAVWYYNARMDLHAWKRAEEARFISDMPALFGPRAMAALHCVADRIGLDYFGVDCGVMPDGRLVVFEIETGMLVHEWDSADMYPYKPAAARSIRSAITDLIDSRIASHRV